MRGVDLRGVALYLARHPASVPAVAGAAWRLRANGWWRTRPFLPLPDPAYWGFRLMTATGSYDGVLEPREVVDAATWAARQRVGQ